MSELQVAEGSSMNFSRSLCSVFGCLSLPLLSGVFLQGCGGSVPSPSPAPPPSPAVNMPTLKLLNGVEMPIMSAGTWQYNVTEAQTVVEAALAAGFAHIDTAYNYFNQEGVGKGLRHAMSNGMSRESIFLTTKVPGCGVNNVSAVSVETCKNDTAARIAEDLRLLGLEYIDLLLIHFPPCAGEDGTGSKATASACGTKKTCCTEARSCDMIKAQWRALTEAYDKKQLRAVGVSNYCRACFKCFDQMNATVLPMVNQVHYQVGMGPDPEGTKTLASSRNIILQAYSPLGLGGKGSREIMKGKLTSNIAKKYNKSAVQVALKWIVSKNVSVSTKSSNEAHLKENLDIFDFELDPADLKALDEAAFAGKDKVSFLCSDALDLDVPVAKHVVV